MNRRRIAWAQNDRSRGVSYMSRPWRDLNHWRSWSTKVTSATGTQRPPPPPRQPVEALLRRRVENIQACDGSETLLLGRQLGALPAAGLAQHPGPHAGLQVDGGERRLQPLRLRPAPRPPRPSCRSEEDDGHSVHPRSAAAGSHGTPPCRRSLPENARAARATACSVDQVDGFLASLGSGRRKPSARTASAKGRQAPDLPRRSPPTAPTGQSVPPSQPPHPVRVVSHHGARSA